MRQRGWLILLFVLAAATAGCTSKNFLVSAKDYQNTVKTLGVLPLLVDAESDVIHPERSGVIQLLKTHSQGKTAYLVDELKGSKSYYDVRLIGGDADDLFANLIQGRELVTRPGSFYRSYRLNTAYAGELCRKNLVDGILVIVLNGVVTPRKFWDRTPITYLETNYNLIVESAQVISTNGQMLWEYSGDPDSPFLTLQYPDFDEAHYNKTDGVKLKFVTLKGLETALQEPSSSLLGQDSVPRVYRQMLDRVADQMKLGWW